MESTATLAPLLTTAEFVDQCRETVIPLTGSLGYFSVLPLDDDERDRLIHDPTSAFPPKLLEVIPNLRLILVPYLVKDPSQPPDTREASGCVIDFRPPPDSLKRLAAYEAIGEETYLFLAVRDEDLFDAHVLLYHSLADRVISLAGSGFSDPFYAMLNLELKRNVRGEIHEAAWLDKEELLRYRGDAAGRSERLERYQRQALEDTLALYLHGLCCDIDLPAGPKQLPSRYIRSRLLLLRKHLPPPGRMALFPEELSTA